MTAKLLASSVAITLVMGLSLKTCISNKHAKEIQHWADYAPYGITVEENQVFKPHCDGFSCGGGTVYNLSQNTADAINRDGIMFFNALAEPQKGKNTRPLGRWEKFASINVQIENGTDIMKVVRPHFWNGDGANHAASRKLIETINVHPYYVSNIGAEPKIIISPEAQLIYVGWLD